MVARTVIDTTCDFCAEEGKTVKAETVTIGGVKFDACSKHRKGRLAEYEALVERFGRPAGEADSAGDDLAEPSWRRGHLRCGDCRQVMRRNSKYSHATLKHSKKASDIKWTVQ